MPTQPKTAREFIWERCEMDDAKTDEIMQILANFVREQKCDTGNPVRDMDANDAIENIAKLFEEK